MLGNLISPMIPPEIWISPHVPEMDPQVPVSLNLVGTLSLVHFPLTYICL